MVAYSLKNDPNFTLYVTPESETYTMHFQYIRGLMYITVDRYDGIRLAGPMRICEGEWLLPFKAYKTQNTGNFRVIEATRQYPMFDLFPTSCELQYYTREELDALGVEA